MSLKLRNISHRFGDIDAVAKANLEAAPGEIICLFGPSGCGKTTLLRIAAGLETLQSGVVTLDGNTIAEPGRETPPEKRRIGFVFQDYALFPHMTVEKNVSFGLAGVADAKARAAEQIGSLGLEALALRYPHELSGGQQQRVALARALAPGPKALLLDEPFASIDSTGRRRLRENLRRILKNQGVSVVLVTHDPEEALALGDRIALMRDGRIIETAPPQMLFEAPTTAEGAALFPGCQRLEGKIEDRVLKTPAGAFPAGDLSNGDGVAILRRGALAAEADEKGAFEVSDVRFSGPGWLIWLDGRRDDVRLCVAVDKKPEMGAPMTVAADLKKVFVFNNQ